MAIEADILFSEARCYTCTGMVSQSQALTLALMRRWLIALNPAADTSVDGLTAVAGCLGCNSNASLFEQLELGLLSLIEEAM